MADVKNPGYKPVAYQPVGYSGLQYEASSFASADSGMSAPEKDTLLGKINIKDATVGVVGLGNVGLPLAVEFADAGYKVVGIDSDEKVVASISAGVSHVCDVPSERLSRLLEKEKLTPSSDYIALAEVDCVLICVPTPLTKSKEPDITHIAEALDCLFPLLKRGMLVVLESTTYPGTTDELIAERIERDLRLTVGEEIFVVFSPERVDPGNPRWRTKNTPKVLGGVTSACTEIGRALYTAVLDKVHTVRSAREAETVKLLENTFRAVNIGLINELMLMCERMHIDIWNVIEAASTKPFGFMPFFPGPGIGGHCIPLDPLYLSWKARAVDFHNRFIELATDINGNMPRFVVQKLQDLLNDREQSLKGSKIMILGMAYKKNVNDLRESPGLEIYRLLRLKGAWVEFFDPHIPSFVSLLGKTVQGTPLNSSNTAEFDAAVLVTDHDAFDYKRIAEGFRSILDCRNAFASRNIIEAHIVKL